MKSPHLSPPPQLLVFLVPEKSKRKKGKKNFSLATIYTANNKISSGEQLQPGYEASSRTGNKARQELHAWKPSISQCKVHVQLCPMQLCPMSPSSRRIRTFAPGHNTDM